MADENRTAAPALISELLRNPQEFTFYQAVRLLLDSKDLSTSGGLGCPASQEQVRFRPHVSFGFPSSDVQSVDRLDDESDASSRYRMTINFSGLYGSVSPLPAFYTEELIAGNQIESNRRDFLDLFHHRIISLIYYSWEKYRYFLQFQPGGIDRFSQWMYALVGLGGEEQRKGLDLDWDRLLAYVGMLSMRSCSAPSLARIVSHYFRGLPVKIEEYVERRVVIDKSQHALLGENSATLGVDCSIGEYVEDKSGKFRICIGPLSFSDFRKYLPDGQNYKSLHDLVRFTLKDQLEFDVSLRLLEGEIPEFNFSEDNPCRLGWSTWLGEHPANDATVGLSSARL